jgi:gamma-glutamyltranspeptidase/glutathione hydrolase
MLEPRKRPLHTLSSLIVEKGDSRIAIGASGGEHRPLQHTQFVTNLVDYGMTLEGAVDHPRFLWSEGRSVTVEEGYEELTLRNYDLQWLPMPGRTGVCQAIELGHGMAKAVCDVRGDGIPSGF